jgi:hypothetical protein
MGELAAVESTANNLANDSLRHLAAGDLDRAHEWALAALRLRRCESSLRALALAAFARRRFGEALSCWTELKNSKEPD